jgi:hypothetical protein
MEVPNFDDMPLADVEAWIGAWSVAQQETARALFPNHHFSGQSMTESLVLYAALRLLAGKFRLEGKTDAARGIEDTMQKLYQNLNPSAKW